MTRTSSALTSAPMSMLWAATITWRVSIWTVRVFGAFCTSISDEGTEAVGKRLGFLLQEMVREANTMGSKAGDAPILSDVVAIKEELERIREQVENVE